MESSVPKQLVEHWHTIAPFIDMIDFGDNNNSDEGAKIISVALTQNTTIQEIKLHRNSIGKHGAKALSAALPRNAAHQRVNLNGNNIGDEGVKALE